MNGEFEEFTIRLPKGLINLLRAAGMGPQKYIETSIVSVVKADLENGEVFFNTEDLIQRFNLQDLINA